MSEPIWSTGGTGGERAVTEDLEWAVSALRAAADDIATAQLVLSRRCAALELADGVGQAAAVGTLRALVHSGALTLEERLDDTARRVAAVAEAFMEAERKARHRVGFVTAVRERARDAWSVTFAGIRAAAAVGVALQPASAGARGMAEALMPESPPTTTALIDRGSAERTSVLPNLVGVEAVLAFALWAIEHMLGEPWTGVLTAATIVMAPAHSLEDVMRRLHATEEDADGSVRIERWTGEDGITRRIVYIPGTEDWFVTDPNTSDAAADGLLRFGLMPDAARVVEAALVADGAAAGEPVLLAGHSLGGTVATALAGSTAFGRSFNVKGIVTAGSPTGLVRLPASVNALHLEGTRDLVPGLDGLPNQDTPTRTTVHHDVRESKDPNLEGEGETVASAHHLNTYAQTARLVDEGLSPSTDAWLEAESDFFTDAKDASVTVTKYTPGGAGG